MRIKNQKVITETSYCDFKQSVEKSKPKSWLKSVSAFANGFGGSLYFGVNNDAVPVGLIDIQSDAEFISESIKARIDPIPDFELVVHVADNDRHILELNIKAGVITPYYYYFDGSRTAFIRIGNESVVASAIQLNNLVLKGRNVTFDTIPSEYKPDEFTFRLLADTYKKQTGQEFENKHLLSFGLINKDEKLTNAGLLFADDCPLFQSRMFCTRWNGLSKGSVNDDALDDKEYKGNLIELLHRGVDFIANNSKNRWNKVGTGRINKPDYAERAIFETLTNSLIHRDYSIVGSEVHIDMFDDRLVVYSPGGMFDGTLIQERDINDVPSSRRNPVIADVFAQLNYMEKRGSGLKKICDESAKLPTYTKAKCPEFKSEATTFFTVIPNCNHVGKPNVLKDVSELTQLMQSILTQVKTTPNITQEQLSKKLDKSIRTIKKGMKGLIDNNMVERVGSNKKGYWKVIGEYKNDV
jgi:ATP-dependent DNA helicase RecG